MLPSGVLLRVSKFLTRKYFPLQILKYFPGTKSCDILKASLHKQIIRHPSCGLQQHGNTLSHSGVELNLESKK